jgi:hypothetical protein
MNKRPGTDPVFGMNARLIHFVTVAIYAFVSWAIGLFVLTVSLNLPRGVFIFLHLLVNILAFGVVFHYYFEAHKQTSTYTTTILTLVSLFVFEGLFFGFFSSEPGRLLNFIDWIFPAFLIATTVYAIGKRGW